MLLPSCISPITLVESKSCNSIRKAPTRPKRTSATVRPLRYRLQMRCTASSGNHYDTLGVDRTADEETIKAAFRQKAKELHPDVNKQEDAMQKFIDCNTAYETLNDPAKRRQYDQSLAASDPVEEAGWIRRAGYGFEGDRNFNPDDPATIYEQFQSLVGDWHKAVDSPFGNAASFWAKQRSSSWHARVQQQLRNAGRGSNGNLRRRYPCTPGIQHEEDDEDEDPDNGPPGRRSEWTHPFWRDVEDDEEGMNKPRAGFSPWH